MFFVFVLFLTTIHAVPYKIGKPYQIDGQWYYPHANTAYDEIGMASWYGAETEIYKRPTALGEQFDKNKISGAHKTLPLPSIVKVTNLDNGKTLNVRINDRGPFVEGRIIDLSEKAADLLGFRQQGTARVRVKFDKKATQRILSNKYQV